MRFLKSTVVLVLVYIVSSISLLIIILPTVVKAFRSSSSPSSSSSSSLLTHHNIAQSRLLLRPSTTTPSMKTCRTSVNMESKKSSSSSSSSSISTAQKQNEDNNNNGNNKNNNNVNRIWTTVYTKIGSTTSICVAFAFFITLCWKRDALMVSFFLGSILNAIFGKILKRILKHDRPTTTTAIIPINGEVIKEEEVKEDSSMMMMKMKAAVQQQPTRPSDNGMPSSHAMSLGFICTFVALLIPIMTLPLITYAVISLIYRVRISLHSIDQIIVGSILGIFDGSIWWHLCKKSATTNIVDLISSSGIMNEHGLLPWYLLVVPALIGVAVVGSVERRLGMCFQRNKNSSKISSVGISDSAISDENINKRD